MQLHEMHAEFIEVSCAFIETLLASLHKNIIATGTTSLRTIESIYWLGIKTKSNPAISPDKLFLTQWEPYELAEQNIPGEEALQYLLDWLHHNKLQKLFAKTQIIIAPGYRFRIIQALITNFHQPQSTLLLLVAALTGDNWKKIYDHALEHDFRFLSYGDGNLLWLPH